MNAFDASAILALALNEPGAESVERLLLEAPAFVSAVNLAEIYGRYLRFDDDVEGFKAELSAYDMRVVPFDESDSALVASLEKPTKPYGLSLGDRACLALAIRRGLSVVTADRHWAKISGLEVPLLMIR